MMGKGVVLLLVVLWMVVQVWFTRYRVGRHEVEVLWFGLVLRKVSLGNIDDVILGTRFPGEFWVNLGCFRGRFLTIRRKKGWIRYLIITPSKPTEFRTNLYYALGWNPKD